MPDTVCALVCRHYQAEAECACRSSEIPRIRTAAFAARCGRPPLAWEELEALRRRRDEPLVVFGGACIGRLDEEEAHRRGILLHRLNVCQDLVASPRMVESLIAQGSYLLTPGWLEDWRAELASQGSDPALVRDLWRESAKRLLLLDTGTGQGATGLQDLGERLGLPVEVLPVGLEHAQILLEREVLDARLRHQRALSETSLKLAQRQAADRATAMEFLSTLSRSLKEEEVARGIQDLFAMLFLADRVALEPLECDPGQPYLETPGGFQVTIGAPPGPRWILQVEGLANPYFKGHYLNLAVSTAGVCALALQNARTYRAVEESRTYQRLLLDILDTFYQPSGAEGDLARALGFVRAFARVDALVFRAEDGSLAHGVGYPESLEPLRCTRCLQALEAVPEALPPGLERTPRGSLWCNDLPGLQGNCPCVQAGFNAVATIQIRFAGGIVGAVQLHDRTPGRFNPALIEQLEGATRSIGIGLERRHAEESLRVVNRDLEARVQRRTQELATINRELRTEIQERIRAESSLEARSEELKARLRELHCLYEVSNLFEQRGRQMDELCRQAVQLVPLGWSRPAQTSARLRIDDRPFCSSPFVASAWSLLEPITIAGRLRGALEVFVADPGDRPPFHEEERTLLRSLADLIQGLVDHLEMEEEKQEVEQRLLQSQKLEALGTLAGGIAHDFNNALTPIITMADLSLMGLPEGSPLHKALGLIKQSGERAKGLVDQILLFSRKKARNLHPLAMQPLVEETLKFLRATLPTTLEIRAEVDGACRPVLGDPTQVQQILLNLCTNAYHAMQEAGGVLTLRLGETRLEAGDPRCSLGVAPGPYARIEVADTGQGMTREVQARIFEPFFTTKEQGKGTGLGLSVVHGIIASYRGHISVQSQPGRGTTFTILLPLAADEAPAPATPGSLPDLPRGTERILVVDDEPAIRSALESILASLGYRAVACGGAEEALERLRTDPQPFDLVVSDMTMPRITGLELARELRRIRPGLPVILCSGYSAEIQAGRLEEEGWAFVPKPFAIPQLAGALRRLLDRK